MPGRRFPGKDCGASAGRVAYRAALIRRSRVRHFKDYRARRYWYRHYGQHHVLSLDLFVCAAGGETAYRAPRGESEEQQVAVRGNLRGARADVQVGKALPTDVQVPDHAPLVQLGRWNGAVTAPHLWQNTAGSGFVRGRRGFGRHSHLRGTRSAGVLLLLCREVRGEAQPDHHLCVRPKSEEIRISCSRTFARVRVARRRVLFPLV